MDSNSSNNDRLWGILFTLTLGLFGTLGIALWNSDKAEFYKRQSRQLERELLQLQHEYEGYEKAANQLKP